MKEEQFGLEGLEQNPISENMENTEQSMITLSGRFQEQVNPVVEKMDKDLSIEVMEIPNSRGQRLVRADTKAYKDRREDGDIIMGPLPLGKHQYFLATK